MNYEIINLTDNEHNLITEMLNSIEQIENILSSMTMSERIAWFRSKQFPRKIDLKKEISGTVYTVRSHFNVDATETLREKTERILNKNSTISHFKVLNFTERCDMINVSYNSYHVDCRKELYE